MKAPSRTERHALGHRRLTERDIEALVFVERAQPTRRSAVQTRLALSRAVSYRMLRKLRDFGLVKVWVDALEEENRYTLTAAGARLLEERLDESCTVLRGVGRPSEHHDMAVEFYVALEVACARLGWVHLREFHFERDIRRRVGNPRGALLPDAAALLTTRQGETLALALEADTGSEKNPSWVAERKGLAYGALAETGAPLLGALRWRVACIVPTHRRLHRLVKAMHLASVPEGLWYFALREQMQPALVLRPESWQTLRTSADGERAELVCESPLAAVHAAREDGVNISAPDSSSPSSALPSSTSGVSRPEVLR